MNANYWTAKFGMSLVLYICTPLNNIAYFVGMCLRFLQNATYWLKKRIYILVIFMIGLKTRTATNSLATFKGSL
jgi:hypothetical protein